MPLDLNPTIEQIDAMSTEDLRALVSRLQAATKSEFDGITLKVSESGGLSLYGLRDKLPITLKPYQWNKVFGIQEHIKGFMSFHEAEFKAKEVSSGPGQANPEV